jgi:acyl-[acyl carrier protein]--UDP-N-acetylglucosamine O-acyltransferase
VIGGDPQDLSFNANTPSSVRIGARTVIREHVTISCTNKADASTEVGSDGAVNGSMQHHPTAL